MIRSLTLYTATLPNLFQISPHSTISPWFRLFRTPRLTQLGVGKAVWGTVGRGWEEWGHERGPNPLYAHSPQSFPNVSPPDQPTFPRYWMSKTLG